MELLAHEGGEAAADARARGLAEAWAFLGDAWPEVPSERLAREALGGLARCGAVWTLGGEQGGWDWLAGLETLAFDSRVFGRSLGRLAPLWHRHAWPGEGPAGAELVRAAVAGAWERGLEGLTARVPCRDFAAGEALEAAGFRLRDVSVEWGLALGGARPGPGSLPEGLELGTWRPEQEEALADLAARSFCSLADYADRFALDPRLRPGCPALYREWLANSLHGDQADQVLVLARGEDPVGFISLKLPPAAGTAAGCGWVALNALEPAWRGRGLYHHLLARGLGWLEERGAARARVRTKLSQAAVIRAWSRLGARQISADYTFHLWRDDAKE
ncbi:MAG: GNAT family N-acetyltransferase [Deltaproteobacteria bacterium]|nr:GNAT family N-acetyltransferase [Deltaproteobacteria bacterium]